MNFPLCHKNLRKPSFTECFGIISCPKIQKVLRSGVFWLWLWHMVTKVIQSCYLLIQYLVWSPRQTLEFLLLAFSRSQSVLPGVLFFWDREIDFFLASSSHCPHFWWCQWCNEPSSSSSSNVAASSSLYTRRPGLRSKVFTTLELQKERAHSRSWKPARKPLVEPWVEKKYGS